jgi:hypothetical protein
MSQVLYHYTTSGSATVAEGLKVFKSFSYTQCQIQTLNLRSMCQVLHHCATAHNVLLLLKSF